MEPLWTTANEVIPGYVSVITLYRAGNDVMDVRLEVSAEIQGNRTIYVNHN